MNEWNFLESDFTKIWHRGNEYARKSNFDKQKNAHGAAFTATVLTLLQDERVDAANYYDGQPTALFCGLFDYHGVPQKTYYTFKAFQRMTELSSRIRTVIDDKTGGLRRCRNAGRRERSRAHYGIRSVRPPPYRPVGRPRIGVRGPNL
ncbi:hypothetical protein N6H14_19460 [Paenibacillus sp. CC-CFT747]|nr:hypothetical protein N6H14_19460 [Paenibacillus sp. CC-CFT747]